MSKQRKYLGARLRPGMDDDLEKAIEHLDGNTKSEIVRTGARIVLGITSHKVTEVVSKPVPAPRLFMSGQIRKN